MPATPNLLQLQKQLEGIDDRSLRGALQSPQAGPQFLVMLEMDRRSRLRQGNGQQVSRSTTIRDEMFSGNYQPVPPPSMPSPDQGGLASLLDIAPPQQQQQGYFTPPAPPQPQGLQQMQQGLGSI